MSSGTDYVGMVNEKVAQNPVIVFSKTYCPCEQQGWGAHVVMPAGTVAACRQQAAAAFCWHCLATNQQRHQKEPCSLQPLGQGRRKGSQPCQ